MELVDSESQSRLRFESRNTADGLPPGSRDRLREFLADMGCLD